MARINIYDSLENLLNPWNHREPNIDLFGLIKKPVELYVDTHHPKIVAYVSGTNGLSTETRSGRYHVEYVAENRSDLVAGLNLNLKLLETTPSNRREHIPESKSHLIDDLLLPPIEDQDSVDDRDDYGSVWDFERDSIRHSFPWELDSVSPALPYRDEVERMAFDTLLNEGELLTFKTASVQQSAGLVNYVLERTIAQTQLVVCQTGRDDSTLSDIPLVVDFSGSTFEPESETRKTIHTRQQKIQNETQAEKEDQLIGMVESIATIDDLTIYKKDDILKFLYNYLEDRELEQPPQTENVGTIQFIREIESLEDHTLLDQSKIVEVVSTVQTKIGSLRKELKEKAKSEFLRDLRESVDRLVKDPNIELSDICEELYIIHQNIRILIDSDQTNLTSSASTGRGEQVNEILKECYERDLLDSEAMQEVGNTIETGVSNYIERIKDRVQSNRKERLVTAIDDVLDDDTIPLSERAYLAKRLYEEIPETQNSFSIQTEDLNHVSEDSLAFIDAYNDIVGEFEKYRVFTDSDYQEIQNRVENELENRYQSLSDAYREQAVEEYLTQIDKWNRNNEDIDEEVGYKLWDVHQVITSSSTDPLLDAFSPNTGVSRRLLEIRDDEVLGEQWHDITTELEATVSPRLQDVRTETRDTIINNITTPLQELADSVDTVDHSSLIDCGALLDSVETAAAEQARTAPKLQFDAQFDMEALYENWKQAYTIGYLTEDDRRQIYREIESTTQNLLSSLVSDINNGYLSEIKNIVSVKYSDSDNIYEYGRNIYGTLRIIQSKNQGNEVRVDHKFVSIINAYEKYKSITFIDSSEEFRQSVIEELKQTLSGTIERTQGRLVSGFSSDLSDLTTDSDLSPIDIGNLLVATREAIKAQTHEIERFYPQTNQHRQKISQTLHRLYYLEYLESVRDEIEHEFLSQIESALDDLSDRVQKTIRSQLEHWMETVESEHTDNVALLNNYRNAYDVINIGVNAGNHANIDHFAMLNSAVGDLDRASFFSKDRDEITTDILEQLSNRISELEEAISEAWNEDLKEAIDNTATSDTLTEIHKFKIFAEANQLIENGITNPDYIEERSTDVTKPYLEEFLPLVKEVYSNQAVSKGVTNEFRDEAISLLGSNTTYYKAKIEYTIVSRYRAILSKSYSSMLVRSKTIDELRSTIDTFVDPHSTVTPDHGEELNELAEYLSKIETILGINSVGTQFVEERIQPQVMNAISFIRNEFKSTKITEIEAEIDDFVESDSIVESYDRLHVVTTKIETWISSLEEGDELDSGTENSHFQSIRDMLVTLDENPTITGEDIEYVGSELSEYLSKQKEQKQSKVRKSYIKQITEPMEEYKNTVDDSMFGLLQVSCAIQGEDPENIPTYIEESEDVEEYIGGNEESFTNPLRPNLITYDPEPLQNVKGVLEYLSDESNLSDSDIQYIRRHSLRKIEDLRGIDEPPSRIKRKIREISRETDIRSVFHSYRDVVSFNRFQIFILIAVVIIAFTIGMVAPPILGGNSTTASSLTVSVNVSSSEALSIQGTSDFESVNIEVVSANGESVHSESLNVGDSGFATTVRSLQPGKYSVSVIGITNSSSAPPVQVSSTAVIPSSPTPTGTPTQSPSSTTAANGASTGASSGTPTQTPPTPTPTPTPT